MKSPMRRICAVLLQLIIAIYVIAVSYGETAEKRYIFIDGGAHHGQALSAFKTTNLYKKYPWEIFAIEANPGVIGVL